MKNFRKYRFLSILLLACFLPLTEAAAAVPRKRQQQTGSAALQKEFAALEKTLDETEKIYWPHYFRSQYSPEYRQLTQTLEQLEQRMRRFLNRLLLLQKKGRIPQQCNLARDYIPVQDLSRMRKILAQHRLYGEWELRMPMRQSSRAALKFTRPDTAGNPSGPFGLSPEDEAFLLRINHRFNYNLQYHFSHLSNHCKRYHDCRKTLHGTVQDSKIFQLGEESAEYFDALWNLRRDLLRTETLLRALDGGPFPPADPPQNAPERLPELIGEAQRLLDYVSDDFWCGFYSSNRSAKYQALRSKLTLLRTRLLAIRKLLEARGKKLSLEEHAVSLQELLHQDHRTGFANEWHDVGWTFLSVAQIEAGEAPEKLSSELCKASAPAPAAKGKKKKHKERSAPVPNRVSTYSMRLERERRTRYLQAIRALQTGISALAAEYRKEPEPPAPPPPPAKKGAARSHNGKK